METTYITVKQEIVSLDAVPQEQFSNIEAISNYEESVLAVVDNPVELLNAYPFEADSGVYIVAVGGKIAAVNNRRSMIRYLDMVKTRDQQVILVHKLGESITQNFKKTVRECALVS